MLMFIVESVIWCWGIWRYREEIYIIFTNLLLGTTIQDGGKSERSDLIVTYNIMLAFNPKFKIGNKIKNKKKMRNEMKINKVHYFYFQLW